MKAKILVGLLALLLTQTVMAKGPPQKVTISGGDLPGEIEITGDYETLNALAMMSLEDYTTLTPDAPDNLSGDGYLITRYYEQSAGRYFAFDEVRYYPNPDGGRGYVNYIGIVNGSSEYDGKWFRASEAGEAALQAAVSGNEMREMPASTARIVRIFLNVFAAFAAQ